MGLGVQTRNQRSSGRMPSQGQQVCTPTETLPHGGGSGGGTRHFCGILLRSEQTLSAVRH